MKTFKMSGILQPRRRYDPCMHERKAAGASGLWKETYTTHSF